jgi:hypothetical protein
MLTSNVDFMRSICREFDRETDYSSFDEPELQGAFEATVMQLILERSYGSIDFKEVKKIRIGSTVSWEYGDADAIGKVVKVYNKRTALKSKNSTIVRNGSDKNPALKIVQDNGSTVLKLSSEVEIVDFVEEMQVAFNEPEVNINDIPKLIKTGIENIDFRALIHQVIKWKGFDIGVEYRPGDIRFKGSKHERKLQCGYGHIRKYVGADGEALDCYLSDDFFSGDTPSENIYEVIQLSAEDGDFDELKFMLGFSSIKSAKDAYLTEMSASQFGGIKEVTSKELEKYKKDNINYQEAVLKFESAVEKLTSAIQIEGELLSQELLDEIAEINEQDIENAVKDLEGTGSESIGLINANSENN